MSFDGWIVVRLKPEMQAMVAGEQVLDFTEEVKRTYPDGKVENLPPRPVYTSTVRREEAAREDVDPSYLPGGVLCYRYTLPNGQVLVESVQPGEGNYDGTYAVAFLALKDEEGNWVEESIWSPGEISMAIARMPQSMEYETPVLNEYWANWKGKCDDPCFRVKVAGKTATIDGKVVSIDDLHFYSGYCEGQIGPQQYPEGYIEASPKYQNYWQVRMEEGL